MGGSRSHFEFLLQKNVRPMNGITAQICIFLSFISLTTQDIHFRSFIFPTVSNIRRYAPPGDSTVAARPARRLAPDAGERHGRLDSPTEGLQVNSIVTCIVDGI